VQSLVFSFFSLVSVCPVTPNNAKADVNSWVDIYEKEDRR